LVVWDDEPPAPSLESAHLAYLRGSFPQLNSTSDLALLDKIYQFSSSDDDDHSIVHALESSLNQSSSSASSSSASWSTSIPSSTTLTRAGYLILQLASRFAIRQQKNSILNDSSLWKPEVNPQSNELDFKHSSTPLEREANASKSDIRSLLHGYDSSLIVVVVVLVF
jgi:hypothetical protein